MTVAPPTAAQTLLPKASAVVDLGLRACEAYGREDLTERLEAAKRTLADPVVHIVVVGEFKQGKSSLVNALVGAEVCAVDDDVATAVPTYVRFGDEPRAELLFEADPPRRQPIPTNEVRDWVMEGGRTPEPDQRLVGAEVRCPGRSCPAGWCWWTPRESEVWAPPMPRRASQRPAMADALLFVTDASQELTRSELDFLRQAREMCGRYCAYSPKSTFIPRGARFTRSTWSICAVSWTCRWSRFLRHCGYGRSPPTTPPSIRSPAFQSWSRSSPSGSGVVRRTASPPKRRPKWWRSATNWEAQFSAERSALTDPAESERVIAELNAVKSRVEALRTAAAKWSQTLNDGIADLTSDVDYDLRHRIRRVIEEADAAIEETDPADTWPEMESWLESRISHELLASYTMLRDRATHLSEEVAQHFSEASGDALRRITIPDPRQLITAATARVEHKIDLEKMKVGKQAMVALKSAYGGALMFVMLGAMANISLGPLGLGIGLVMGRKGLREEKKRQRSARQNQAKNAVRRYCDEVSFVMSKDSRDTLRRIQRQLRDHYSSLAEQLSRSNAEALQRATEASQRTQEERRKRLRDIEAELARVRKLREHAEAVAA